MVFVQSIGNIHESDGSYLKKLKKKLKIKTRRKEEEARWGMLCASKHQKSVPRVSFIKWAKHLNLGPLSFKHAFNNTLN